MCEYITVKDLQKLNACRRREDFYKQAVKTSDFLGNKQLRRQYFKIRYNSETYEILVANVNEHNSKSIKIHKEYCRYCRRISGTGHCHIIREGLKLDAQWNGFYCQNYRRELKIYK